MDAAGHWETVFSESEDDDVSWTQREPATSLRLLDLARAGPEARVLDVGCGARGLANALAHRGWRHVTGLDLSATALRRARDALGPTLAARVGWVQADVRALPTLGSFDVWHDRAVLHFLTAPKDRAAYVEGLRRCVRPGGHVVIGTFAPDGPDKCSGLPVARYPPEGIVSALGEGFELVHGERETHVTPWGAEQAFAWAVGRRAGPQDALP